MRAVVLLASCGAVVCGCGLDLEGTMFVASDGGSATAIGDLGEGGFASTDGGAESVDAAPVPIVPTSPAPPPSNPSPAPAPPDAGSAPSPAAVADAGLIATPGIVGCGTSSCSLPAFCCVLADAGATCTSSSGACADAGGARRSCDDPSDCMDGDQCCFTVDSVGIPSATCQGDCGGGGTSVKACRAPSDCGGGTCASHGCTSGGPIEACGPLGTVCP